MALDIMSRSLRRTSFFRVLSAILLVQLGVLILWRWALLGAISSGSWSLFIIATIGGKWATGTVARFLSLLACGGVTGWFIEQSALIQDLTDSSNRTERDEAGDLEDNAVGLPSDKASGNIPEAYRTVDASVYQSVLAMDDALDDDFETDSVEFLETPNRIGHLRQQQQEISRSTVKSILWAGLTVSFGSIAQCGLLGGLAQFVWSQLRKIDAARSVLANSRPQSNAGFRGMQIGGESRRACTICNGIHQLLRTFVGRFSDLAMSHVAAYYKSYQLAARDVATLVEDSGTCKFSTTTRSTF